MQSAVLIFSLFLLAGCGDKADPKNAGNSTEVSTPADSQTITVCEINDLLTSVSGCSKVTFGTQLLAEATNSNNNVVMVASKKNGGTGGSRWFDASIAFSSAVNINLPNQIPASGNAGNGQKLYILFNNQTDCTWFSHATTTYQTPRCFTGATRNPGGSSGFNGGTEVFVSNLTGVTKIEMTVNGASGNGVVTTATATFTKTP